MRTHPFLYIAGALIAVVPAFISCGSDDGQLPRPRKYVDTTPDADADAGDDAGLVRIDPCTKPGHAGCPCAEVGAVADCGQLEYQNGDYVTCTIGQSTCDGQRWGTCVGNRVVAQSLRGLALTPEGRRVLSIKQDCQSPCDPQCTQVVGQTTDIDAGGLTYTDAGVTLTQTTGAGPGSGPCKGLWCNVDACPGLPKTSVSGIVYDPAGKVPLYNAYVYIPVDGEATLPGFTSGVSCDTCAGASNVSAVAVAQTGADGKFTLTNVPYGDTVPLVVQMGKWRRKITLPAITKCVNNPLDKAYTRLPRNRSDGDGNQADIPRMAIATGDADPFECLLLKAGIDPDEILIPATGAQNRIDYYKYNGVDRAPGGAPAGSTLTGSLDTLKKYDVVLLPCEGAENAHNTQAPNIVSYTGLGGRMFTTHYGYVWLATPSSKNVASNLTTFYGTANWKLGLNDYSDPMTATVDQTFPKGAAFAQWLQNVSATTTLGKPSINEPRHNALTTISPSQRWVYGKSNNTTTAYQDMLLSMTFNTPVGVAADKQCGRVVFSDFHVSADALVGSSTTCSSDTDCGFTSTCKQPVTGTCAAKTCTSNSACSTGYTCNGAALGSCSTQACYSNSNCGTGRTCTGGVTGTCALPCYQKSDCGKWSWLSCSGGAFGTCSTPSCKADSDCGNSTCSGETIGNCVPAAKSCWANGDCTSLNAAATCNGAVTGTCSTTCKADADCGTGVTCTGVAQGTCKLSSTHSCWTTADCTTYSSAATCGGVTNGTCSTATCHLSSECASGTCSGTTSAGKCKKGSTYYSTTCWKDSDCSAHGSTATCSGPSPTLGKCVCAGNSQCASNNCQNDSQGTCSVPATSCWYTSDCTSLYGTNTSCSGASIGSCPAKSGCKADSDCGGTRTCNGESIGSCTGPSKTCWTTSDCGSLGTQYSCNGATIGACSGLSCETDTDCGGARTCSGSSVGKCSNSTGSSCTADSACGTGETCEGEVAGTCAAGSCYANGDCGSSGTCTAGSMGACQKTCTSSSTCGSLSCVSGLCQGCTADSQCVSSNCVGDSPRTCSASGSMFPLTCRNGDLSGQEKALEFMLFDLSACVSPDSWAPPVPSISYSPVTFTLDFESSCPTGQMPVWREFDWKASVPTGTNIVYSVQTASTIANLATATSAALATATTSTTLPGWDVAIVETTAGGAFLSVTPRLVSLEKLRVTVTLNPSDDKKAAPTLNAWQVGYDCVDRQ